MKKITIFCLFVFLFFVTAKAENSLSFSFNAKTQKEALQNKSVTFLKYSDGDMYQYDLTMKESKNTKITQGFFLQADYTFLKERVGLYAGVGMDKLEFTAYPNYWTRSWLWGVMDEQNCIGDMVQSSGDYKPYWFAGAKITALKGKKWAMGFEAFYSSSPKSKLDLTFQHISNKWPKAEMEFSVKGDSVKAQSTEVKVFGNFQVFKDFDLNLGVGGRESKNTFTGEGRYFYNQGKTNVNFSDKWEMTSETKTKLFAEVALKARLTRNINIMANYAFGAKQVIAFGVQISFGKKNTTTTVALPTIKPIIPEGPAPVKSIAPKKATNKPVVKTTPKKTVVAPKEAAKKPTVAKKNNPPCNIITKTVIVPPSTNSFLFCWGMRLIGFDIFNFGFKVAIPDKSPTSKK